MGRPRPLPQGDAPVPGTRLTEHDSVHPSPRPRTRSTVGFLALVSYVPLLLTAPGQVGADTKQYLYLDPDRLLGRAASMWDPNIGMGTVTHQNIGYLFPMGPWYWAFEHLGVPDWVAQRLWLGTIMLAAGTGVLFLLRTLGVRGKGAAVAALAYALTPYTLDFAARLSVLLLPWAGLPWMIALTARALRRGGWRDPALFALVVLAIGGVNATALLYAGLGPVLWVPFAVWVLREVTVRQALATVARIGVLTVLTSLWWVAGLSLQAGYGLDVLRYTETVETVALTSLVSEVLRGLGYWFFYGRDKLGPWIEPGFYYTQYVWLIVASFTVPAFAFAAAALTRWRHRAYFIALVVLGTTIAVGAYPFEDPSPLGGGLKAAATGSTVGLAMRSTGRAVPLVALGLAVLLGAGIAALERRRTGWATVAASLVAGLVVTAMAPLWAGKIVAHNLRRPEEVPSYWQAATAWLDARGDGTRVLELPGSDFASYRWGNTVDPITPGLIDRPYVARELIPYGSPPSADLLAALDRRLQEGVLEPEAIAPIAHLLGVGDVVLRNDLQFERYNLARPRPTHQLLTPTPPGLDEPVGFGPPLRNTPEQFPMIDEIALALPAGAPDPAPVVAYPVRDPTPIVRAQSAARPVVMAGDGEGVVEAAAAGLLSNDVPLLYSAAFVGDRKALTAALDAGADLLVTDSNRRRGRRWSTVRENTGYTEQAGEQPLVRDLRDARLPLFPDAPDDAYTVAQLRGVRGVRASGYGNPVTYTPEDRPVLALDGDPQTAWRVAAFDDPVGERIEIELRNAMTTDHITLQQPTSGPRNRYMTRATLKFDRGRPVTVELTEASRRPGGQPIDIGRRTIRRVEIEVDDTNVGRKDSYTGFSAVGLAEIGIGDVRVDEVVHLPTDLLTAAGDRSIDHRLTILLARARSAQLPPRADEELTIARSFSLPARRTFSLTGTVRVSAAADDATVDRTLGATGIRATSSGRLPGNLRARPSLAIDGDQTTFWSSGLGQTEGMSVTYDLSGPVTIDHLDLVVVADGRHSVPTRLRVEAGGQAQEIDLPAIPDGESENATARATARFAPITGDQVRVTVVRARQVMTTDWYSEGPVALPLGLAELGMAGVRATPPPAAFPESCRTDLLTIDGRSIGVRIIGTRDQAERRQGMRFETCGPDASGIELDAGPHELRTRAGRDQGIDIDRLMLGSDPGGDAARAGRTPATDTASPSVDVLDEGRTSFHLRVRNAREPFWLVLGESHNLGWAATGDGRDLGQPQIVNGYANGWYVEPDARGTDVDIRLRWAPQQRVWWALALSAIGVVACIALAVIDPKRRRTATDARSPAPELASPFTSGVRMAVPPRTRAGATVAAGLGAGLIAGVPTGLLVGAIVLVALSRPSARVLLTAGSVGAIALAGLYTAAKQLRYDYLAQFEWPTRFHVAHTIAWLAVCLLAADALVEHVARRQEE